MLLRQATRGTNITVEIKEDTVVIPRSSTIIVKRVPAARPGRGKAAYYTAGVPGGAGADKPGWKGSMSKRFDGKEEPPKPVPVCLPSVPFDLSLNERRRPLKQCKL